MKNHFKHEKGKQGMNRKTRAEKILRIIKSQIRNRAYIDRAGENALRKNRILNSEDEKFRILISIILSARTKDELTEKVSERIFKNYSVEQLQKFSAQKISRLIYPVGFYKKKAENIKKLFRKINEEFDGKIPKDLENLLMLPGVGRKTANLYLSVVHKKPSICVDTHVHRISNRIGFVKTKTPLETEMALEKIFAKEYWSMINEVLVPFGKEICRPVNPKCSICIIRERCNYYKEAKNKKKRLQKVKNKNKL
ncbi:MAG: endonuclease III domain-containing protein [Candidatus Woesearchaeota archaeon]